MAFDIVNKPGERKPYVMPTDWEIQRMCVAVAKANIQHPKWSASMSLDGAADHKNYYKYIDAKNDNTPQETEERRAYRRAEFYAQHAVQNRLKYNDREYDELLEWMDRFRKDRHSWDSFIPSADKWMRTLDDWCWADGYRRAGTVNALEDVEVSPKTKA